MKFSPTNLALFVVLGLLCIITPALGANLLTDTELDELGAGGESLAQQAGDSAIDPLSDQILDQITARGTSAFIWPFQYAPLRLPGPKRITWSSGGFNIDLGPAFQGRGLNTPPSQGGAGSANSFPP